MVFPGKRFTAYISWPEKNPKGGKHNGITQIAWNERESFYESEGINFKVVPMSKYDKFDQELFEWLDQKKSGITTADAITSLGIDKDRTKQRHVSRRFSQLEDRGIIKCSLKGTTRICKVVGTLPATMAKKVIKLPHLRTYPQPREITPCDKPSIKAENSDEFVANGGTIEVLPNNWDKPRVGSKPMGHGPYDNDE